MDTRISKLPVDGRGYPIPWFVEWVDGVADFRVMSQKKWHRAIREGLCWVCGERLFAWKTFVVGPMCAVNQTSAEPPCHFECALYSAQNCPFLTNPDAVRRDRALPKDHQKPPGLMICRNPGVTLLWTTKSYKMIHLGDGFLIEMGEPAQMSWFREGRKATHREVVDSINSGVPILSEAAKKDGPEGLQELHRRLQVVAGWVDSEAWLDKFERNMGDITHCKTELYGVSEQGEEMAGS